MLQLFQMQLFFLKKPYNRINVFQNAQKSFNTKKIFYENIWKSLMVLYLLMSKNILFF